MQQEISWSNLPLLLLIGDGPSDMTMRVTSDLRVHLIQSGITSDTGPGSYPEFRCFRPKKIILYTYDIELCHCIPKEWFYNRRTFIIFVMLGKCTRSFNDPSNLRRHEQSCNGEQMLSEDEIEQTQTSPQITQAQPKKEEKEEVKPHRCGYCSKVSKVTILYAFDWCSFFAI